jgi:hypothetical protein
MLLENACRESYSLRQDGLYTRKEIVYSHKFGICRFQYTIGYGIRLTYSK